MGLLRLEGRKLSPRLGRACPRPPSPGCTTGWSLRAKDRRQRLRHPIGFLVDLLFGKPQNLIAATLQLEIPATVVLKGLFAAVVEVAVGFYHEPSLTPDEVDQVRADGDIDLRPREPMTTAEPQEVSLEVTTRPVLAALPTNRQAKNVRPGA